MFKHTHHKITLAIAAIATFPVFALTASAQTINEDIKLSPADGSSGDWFGKSIAIDNGTIAVGSYTDNDNGQNSGSAYLFDSSTSMQLFKLLPDDGGPTDLFGNSIAIDNGIVAVGAIWENNNTTGTITGSAYLFDSTTGKQLFKIRPDDVGRNDEFGISIALDNGILAVGSWGDNDNGFDSGSAYLFDASTGEQLFKLLPSDGAENDGFGYSISINNGLVGIGAYGDDDNGESSGSVYLFDASTGKQILKLLPNDGDEGDLFGYSIDIANNLIAIGARSDTARGVNSGSAYLFNASTGAQLFKLIASDGAHADRFGTSIAIDHDVVAVGARQANDLGNDSGSAYLFDVSTGAQLYKLLPSDGAANDSFGHSIAIENGIISVGANKNNNSGSAYVFTTPRTCAIDLNNDNTLNFLDVSAFITALTNDDPIADFNNDNRWNFFDVSAFLSAFAQGCP